MKEFLIAIICAFAASAVLCPLLIPVLRKLKFGQNERAEGPESHLKKAGTPTMGGIAILGAIIIVGGIFCIFYPENLSVLLVTAGFGAVGFCDDYLKVVKKNTKGLKPLYKMAGQFVITTAFVIYLLAFKKNGTEIIVPFTKTTIDLGFVYVPFVYLVMLATDNGVNFSDGVDGLCSSVTCVVAAFFGYFAAVLGALPGGDNLSPVCGCVIGALMGFLISNLHPAKVFMGDTGSLALGGFVGSIALVLRLPLLILFVGVIYACELLSVIIQVTYFKKTHGKRIFRMAPIHHHFELGGWSETKVVGVFTIVTVIGGAIGLLGLLV
jgi:phospho-N-acetylmuramoyl-pentapeptide-transferase